MSSRFTSISSKVTVMIIMASSLFALLTMLIQLLWNYLGAVGNARNEIHGYSELILPTLAQALWDVDRSLQQDLLSGMEQMPNVGSVELASRDGVYIKLGGEALPGSEALLGGESRHSADAVAEPVVLAVNYEGERIATLTIALDRSEIYSTLWHQMVPLLLGNALKTLAMAFVILYLLKHLIMKRLLALSSFADAVGLSEGARAVPALQLDRKNDEIGQVASALEAMYRRIRGDWALIRQQQRKLALRGRALSHTVERQDDMLKWMAQANQLLAEVSLRFLKASATDSAAELGFFTENLGQMLAVERVAVMEFGDGRVSYRGFWSPEPDAMPARDLLIDNLPALHHKFGQTRTVVIEDVEQICDSDPLEYRYLKQVGITSVAGFAITDGDTLLGVLAVSNLTAPLCWSPEKSAILTQFAAALNELWLRERREQRMLELQQELMRVNVKLAEEAVTDALTGLSNRRPFVERLSAEIFRTGALLMIDVDFFKRYNDSYGHLAGDDVLKRLAQLLKETLPKNALPARIGGEEFAVVIPGMDAEALTLLCRDLLDAVRMLAIPHQGSHLGHVSLSIGAVSLEHCSSVRDAMGKADASLYLAKEQGRNTAVVNGSLSVLTVRQAD